MDKNPVLAEASLGNTSFRVLRTGAVQIKFALAAKPLWERHNFIPDTWYSLDNSMSLKRMAIKSLSRGIIK